MRTSIDQRGRIVVPKPIRDRLRIFGGEVFEVEERDGVIEVRLVPSEISVRDTPEGPVADAVDHIPTLTDTMVRELLEQGRR